MIFAIQKPTVPANDAPSAQVSGLVGFYVYLYLPYFFFLIHSLINPLEYKFIGTVIRIKFCKDDTLQSQHSAMPTAAE